MRRSFLLVVLAAVLASAGCASTIRLGGPEHSCSPGFDPSNEFGALTAQQRGPGGGIQWGVYPKVPAVRYVVDVFVNNRLEGQGFNARGDVGLFFLTCQAA